jgi:predicted DNA-binding transcriptional regulator AlpA
MTTDNTFSTNAGASATIGLRGFADGDLITKRELGKCLGCSDRTIQCMVERFELPPMGLAGRKVWLAGKIRAWLAAAAERREAEALKEARRLKVFML